MDEKVGTVLDDKNGKKRWIVQKLPIKGGTVLRSAMLTEDCKNVPDWVQIEGVTKS